MFDTIEDLIPVLCGSAFAGGIVAVSLHEALGVPQLWSFLFGVPPMLIIGVLAYFNSSLRR